MFEKALITRVGNAGVDFGVLAETILFYGCTHLLLNRGSVVNLATKLPADDLLALLDRGEVRLSYLRPGYGVVTAGHFGAHNLAAITLEGHKEDARPGKGVRLNYKEEIDKELRRALSNSTATRKLARAIGDRLALNTFKDAPQCSASTTLSASRQPVSITRAPAFSNALPTFHAMIALVSTTRTDLALRKWGFMAMGHPPPWERSFSGMPKRSFAIARKLIFSNTISGRL